MMKSETPKFIQVQKAFAAHLRDPEKHPAPIDIEDRRMEIYRSLFYGNVESFISGGFPVLRALISDKDWHEMVRDFFANHHSQTPYFLEISQEFLQYLTEEGRNRADSLFPFCLELAHYEWAELAVSVMEDTPERDQIDSTANLLESTPVISQCAWNLTYQYPVHQISPENCPQEVPETPTHLVVYRDSSCDVKFLEINSMTAVLLDTLQSEPALTGKEALIKVAEQAGYADTEALLEPGKGLLTDLKTRGIILGGRKKAK